MKKFILCSTLSLMLFSSFVLALTAEDILEQQEDMLEKQGMVEAKMQQDQGRVNSIFALSGFLFVVMIILLIITIVTVIWALVNILRSNMSTGEKVGWAALCLIAGLIGVIVYYFVVKRKRVPEEKLLKNPTSEKRKSNFCHNCGKEAKQGTKFCPSCGEKL